MKQHNKKRNIESLCDVKQSEDERKKERKKKTKTEKNGSANARENRNSERVITSVCIYAVGALKIAVIFSPLSMILPSLL